MILYVSKALFIYVNKQKFFQAMTSWVRVLFTEDKRNTHTIWMNKVSEAASKWIKSASNCVWWVRLDVTENKLDRAMLKTYVEVSNQLTTDAQWVNASPSDTVWQGEDVSVVLTSLIESAED